LKTNPFLIEIDNQQMPMGVQVKGVIFLKEQVSPSKLLSRSITAWHWLSHLC
jgi:hypothetical protein